MVIFSLVLITSILTGCIGQETSNSSPTAANATADNASVTTEGSETNGSKENISGACSNEYYPITASEKRDYKVSGVESHNYTLTQKDITAEGFKEDRDFSNGIVITNNWICTEDGLRTAEFTNQGMSKDMKFEMETLKSEGVTIPKTLETGKEWNASYDVKVKLNAAGLSTAADGDVKVTNKVAAIDEPLSIDGKEYKTAKIDSDIKIVVTMNGRRTEAATVKVTNWYAKDIGLVKQVTAGALGKQTVEYSGANK